MSAKAARPASLAEPPERDPTRREVTPGRGRRPILQSWRTSTSFVIAALIGEILFLLTGCREIADDE